jgi:hypothetical protein
MNPYMQRYTVADLDYSMPSLDTNIMQSWFVRGMIELSDKSPGRGKKRLYSFHDALKVNLVSIMTWNRDPADLAGKVAKVCADFYADWLMKGNSPECPPVGEEFVIVFTPRGQLQKKDGRLEYGILKKKDYNINDQSLYHRVLDFHYCAWRLYETLEDITNR